MRDYKAWRTFSEDSNGGLLRKRFLRESRSDLGLFTEKAKPCKGLTFLFDQPFDLTQAFCDRDFLRTDLGAPPHGPAAPDAIPTINLCQPALCGCIARIGDISEGTQKSRRTHIVFIRPADGAGRRARGAENTAERRLNGFLFLGILRPLPFWGFFIIDQEGPYRSVLLKKWI